MKQIDVVVPSYQRPRLLQRCLHSLASQTLQPERIVVVARKDDTTTRELVERWRVSQRNVACVTVDTPGVVAAMTAGVTVTTRPIVAFTDDDAAPRPDWLMRISDAFSADLIGGVGGRDVIRGQDAPLTTDVGRLTPYGRVIGNHHLGCGGLRGVDILKGVNMAFRAEALALPRAGVLRGTGAQVHFEVLVSGYARQHGWRLVYDPSITVDHEVGARTGADARWKPMRRAVRDAAFNASFTRAALNGRRLRWLDTYGILVGSRAEPGVGRGVVALLRYEREPLRRLPSSLVGHACGLAESAKERNLDVVMISANALRSPPSASF